jgi:hypothetical protein
LQIIGGPSPAERAAVDGLDPTWIRARVFWSPSVRGWGWSDAVVSYAETAGARLILEWWTWRNAGPGADCSDVEVDAHATFAADLAARYRGRVDAYQIDNEPDLHPDRCGGALAYAARYAAVRAAIEAADPQAVVLPAGLAMSPVSTSYLLTMLGALDVPPPAVAVHAYPELGDAYAKIEAARSASRLPVWVTETGASGAVPETVRAGMRACAGVPVCIVYRAADDDDARRFGLYDVLGRPKPAADVYREEVAR